MPAPVWWRVKRMIAGARHAWAEMDYAQRRMFELRTGISLPPARHGRARPRIEDLEALYALAARELDDDSTQPTDDRREC